MKLETVNTLEWVRTREGDLFAAGRATPMGLMAYVISDVLEIGKGECRVVANGAWWLVSSNVDWMHHAALSTGGLFDQVVPAPEHGEHSIRAEVLLNAFARDLVTEAPSGRLLVKGSAPEDQFERAVMRMGWAMRLVAFRL